MLLKLSGGSFVGRLGSGRRVQIPVQLYTGLNEF